MSRGIEQRLWLQEAVRMDREAELQYLIAFVKGAFFEADVCCQQLRSLWTAYCLHQNLDVDTRMYDNDLMMIWETVEDTGEEDTMHWGNFDSFNDYMCEFLI